MPTLFLIRHGSTLWTEEKRFTGWGDAPLSTLGYEQLRFAAESLKRSGCSFDVCYTSQLTRAKNTATEVLEELNLPLDILKCDWRLNERHYGALEGELRSSMIDKYGLENVTSWRKDYQAQPPKLDQDDPRWIEQLDRFSEVPLSQQPLSESMEQAAKRMQDIWANEIAVALKAGKNVMIVAHTNSIRTVVGIIEGLNHAQLGIFRISSAAPRRYDLTTDLEPLYVQDLTSNWSVKIRTWTNQMKIRFHKKS